MNLKLQLCSSALAAGTVTGLPAHAIHSSKPAATPGERVDFAESAHVDDWLRHPVYGDPSFDSFKRLPGNPIHRGSGEFAWPVNGFLFLDPVSGNWYIYVGDYRAGYAVRSRCLLLRSKDKGKSWEDLGPVVQGDPKMFDKDGHTPDATVVYDQGRYHMVYDWGELNFNAEGGLAYAWADRPEGPWHRAPEPLTRISTLPKLCGRYYRTYGGMLFRRKRDWMILVLLDYAPHGWALGAMTGKRPEGPYDEPHLVRQVESDYFHPPFLEFFPAFTRDGWIYAPATSVALNRNFLGFFRAPIESADKPTAWQVYRYGSNWHSEDVENEAAGLWGQAYSGQVLPDGRLMAAFNSRDPNNLGTVNLAVRPWAKPLRARGFVLSGHAGPSFTCIDRSYGAFELRADLKVRGTARIVWGYQGALGPDKLSSDASLHPLMLTRHAGLELFDGGWKVIEVDAAGATQVLGEGRRKPRVWHIAVKREVDGQTDLSIDGKEAWHGVTTDADGPLGLSASLNTHAEVTRFELEGESRPAHLSYLYTEGLVGAAAADADWEVVHGPTFRFGVGAIHKGPGGMAKWNFYGAGVRLWSPTGPELGSVQVKIDGRSAQVIDLHSDSPRGPVMVWERKGLRYGPHCLVVRSVQGVIPVDGVEVISTGR